VGDAVLAVRGAAQGAQDEIGEAVERPHHGLEHGGQPLHGPHEAHGQTFRLEHAQPLGQQIGKDDEGRRDAEKRGQHAQRASRGRRCGIRKYIGEQRGQSALAHDAAQNRHGVQAQLHHGEIVAGLFLDVQHALRTHLTVIDHLAQTQAPRRGQGDLSHRKKSAQGNQRQDQQQTGGQAQESLSQQGVCKECSGLPALVPAAPVQSRGSTSPTGHPRCSQ
jgi:hypothetical protein